jgi:hypothetical protein
MKKARKGKGGNGIFHTLWSCLVSDRKAIVNHFRLVGLQVASEGESGAQLKNASKKKRQTPPPELD